MSGKSDLHVIGNIVTNRPHCSPPELKQRLKCFVMMTISTTAALDGKEHTDALTLLASYIRISEDLGIVWRLVSGGERGYDRS